MPTQFAFTNDDAGSGGPDMIESFRRTCAYLESRGLHGTWFVVPKANGVAMTPEWKRALMAAQDAGHDLQLHGLTHADCYEFGPPVEPAISIIPQFVADYNARRSEMEARYTVEKMRARIDDAMETFQRELGSTPTIFRAPCGAISEAMFEALSQVGIRFESSQYINMGCYRHLLNEPPAQDWTDAWPHRPFRWIAGVIEIPILGEYTWRLASQRPDEFLSLAKADCDRITRESPVAALPSHTHGIASDYDYAFRTFDAVFEHITAGGGSVTPLSAIARSGLLDRLAVTGGPINVPVTNWVDR